MLCVLAIFINVKNVKVCKELAVIRNSYSTLSFKKEFEVKDIYVKDGNLFIVPNAAQKAETVVQTIQNLVKNSQPEVITVNLCGLNMFDALKIASLTGAYGLINNSNNRYEIFVDDKIAMEQIKLLSLSNVKVSLEKVNKAPQKARELVVVV